MTGGAERVAQGPKRGGAGGVTYPMWVRTKHGPGVHGPPLWTGSMDHFHGPGPWTPCHGPGPWTVFFDNEK